MQEGQRPSFQSRARSHLASEGAERLVLLIRQRSGGQMRNEEPGGKQSQQQVKSQPSLMLAFRTVHSCHLALS